MKISKDVKKAAKYMRNHLASELRYLREMSKDPSVEMVLIAHQKGYVLGLKNQLDLSYSAISELVHDRDKWEDLYTTFK